MEKLLCFLFVLLIFSPSMAQIDKPKSDDVKITIFNAANYKEWQKIDMDHFSFYLPKDVKKDLVKCIDSRCYKFKGPLFDIAIDITDAAGRPYEGSPRKKLPSYLQKYQMIDGVMGLMWSFQSDTDKFKYFSGIFMFCKDKNKQFNIRVTSKTTDINEISEKIFTSIQFKVDSVCKDKNVEIKGF